jgi:HEPN domain-containing protein
MKKPLETARRWLAQAEHSLSVTRLLIDNGVWSQACFQAEQTAQLALKAFLFSLGRRYIHLHSVRELAQECGKDDKEFLRFNTHGSVLDRYYLATRYPDALPAPAVPFESFTQEDAEQAMAFVTEIVELVRAKIPGSPSAPAQ